MRFWIMIFIVLVSCNSNKKNNTIVMEKIELKDNTSIKCKALSKYEFDKILSSHSAGALSEYKTKYSIDVYEISSQEVLVQEGNYYTLYYSLSDLNAVLNGSSFEDGGREILYGKNPFDSDFPRYTYKLIEELALSLQLNPSKTFSLSYLQEVNEKINSLDSSQEFFEKKFINIIALIGEAVVEKYHASWDMKLGDDKITWNPYLNSKDQSINFFSFLYEDIFIEKDTKDCIPEIYHTVSGIISNLK